MDGNWAKRKKSGDKNIRLSDAARRLILEALSRCDSNDTPPITVGAVERLCGSISAYYHNGELTDPEGFSDARRAGSEIGEILGCVAYALKNDFDQQNNISYRTKYPYANRNLREGFISMLDDKTASRQQLHDLIEEVENQCSTYGIRLKTGRDAAKG